MRAPELPQDFTWLNTPRPLSLRELRGHLVILDFWTYCCINCMHVLPVLDAIEQRHHDEPLVVIGVHSAKFDEEHDPVNVRDAIARYGVRHPVVVDREMKIWHDFAIRSWPTLVVVRPDGTIAAVAPGEPDRAALEQFVSSELDRARSRGQLAKEPLRLESEGEASETALRFPGKLDVAADGRIAISDSGHHRVLIVSPEGTLLDVVGTGAQGHRDGAFGEAELDDPQGVRFSSDGASIYVADARNHVVLRADLSARTITTVAGNGQLGAAPIEGTHPAHAIALRSPWDLAVAPARHQGDGETIYVALAGSHQIGALDVAQGTFRLVAGTGAESMVDGSLDAEHSIDRPTFSQPSGLALRGHELFVADSETSSVRVVDLGARTVRTLVGAGLFDFGDVDGAKDRARMQHCLGIAIEGDIPVIADTYNHKLKRLDPDSSELVTFFRGADGHILREPGGVAWDPTRRAFLVADTGHGRIVEVSPDGGKARVLELRGVPAPAVRRRAASVRAPSAQSTNWFDVVLEETTPLATGEARVVLDIVPREGLHLAEQSRLRVAVEVSRRSDLLIASQTALSSTVTHADRTSIELPFRVTELPDEAVASEALLTIECVTCTDGGTGAPAACIPVRAYVRLPLRLANEGGHAARFEIPVGEPL